MQRNKEEDEEEEVEFGVWREGGKERGVEVD